MGRTWKSGDRLRHRHNPALGMGSDPRKDPAAGPQEQPLHRVTLDAFEIDRYEVSNVEYLRFVLATGASWPQF